MNPQEELRTGYFIDGPVQGLAYRTATQNGETGADGAFTYQPGEAVDFYVGDILIGQAAGADALSPFDLAGIAPPVSGSDIKRSINRLRSSRRATPFEVAANIAVF
ncbi:MAG: hypothetical protein WAU91_02160, partial [Desulfatitalea sp.]